jgi:hypothetical protein
MRAEIARRSCRCLLAGHLRPWSQLHERAVRPLEISLAPGIVLISSFSSPAASHAPLRPGPRRCALLPRQTERRIAPGPRSRICALPFTGGGAGACLRIGIHFYIYLHHTWSRTQTPRTPGSLYGCLHGPVRGGPIRNCGNSEACASAAYSTVPSGAPRNTSAYCISTS